MLNDFCFKNIIGFQNNHSHIVSAKLCAYLLVQPGSRVVIGQRAYYIRVYMQIFCLITEEYS